MSAVNDNFDTLREIAPSTIEGDVLSSILVECNDNLEAAVEYVFTHYTPKEFREPPADLPVVPLNGISTLIASLKQLETVPINALSVDVDNTDARTPPTTRTPLHESLDNGDCVFFCLWDILARICHHALGLRITNYADFNISHSNTERANHMRTFLFAYIESRWFCRVKQGDDDRWCDVVRLAHNIAVPDFEREDFAVWTGDEYANLQSWKNERDEMYGGTPEIMAFIDIMKAIGVSLVIRIWRTRKGRTVLSETVPHCNIADEKCIIANLRHSGRMDTNNAHVSLFASGSFRGSEETLWVEDTQPAHKKQKNNPLMLL